MSNYIEDTYHPETGEVFAAEWLDDYYGRHRYGVRFPDGKVFNEILCVTVRSTLKKPEGDQ
jgi:hypothetical protein